MGLVRIKGSQGTLGKSLLDKTAYVLYLDKKVPMILQFHLMTHEGAGAGKHFWKPIIRRRVRRLSYPLRYAKASALQAQRRQGITLARGMEMGHVVQ